MLELTTATFDQEVTKSSAPVVVDFWAPWCGPCKIMSPLLEELAQAETSFAFAKVNVDENSELAMRFNVLSIPTFIVLKGGSEVGRFSGAMSKDAFKEKLQQLT
jgi:thioredoxin 1